VLAISRQREHWDPCEGGGSETGETIMADTRRDFLLRFAAGGGS